MAIRFTKGSLVVGRFRGAPIRIHWTTPLGVLFFSGLNFAPGAWLAFVLVILVHELGHAVAVAACRQRTVAIDVHGFGGLCWWEGDATPLQRAIIAWGGVIAQAVLGIATLLVLAISGQPESVFAAQLLGAFLAPNFWMIVLNLLPMPPLDGAEAWKIVPILAARARRRRAVAAARTQSEQSAKIASMARLELRSLDQVEEADELPPLPDEVKRVLERVMRDGRAQHEADKKGK